MQVAFFFLERDEANKLKLTCPKQLTSSKNQARVRFQTSFSDVVCLRNKASTETNLHVTSELSRFVLV